MNIGSEIKSVIEKNYDIKIKKIARYKSTIFKTNFILNTNKGIFLAKKYSRCNEKMCSRRERICEIYEQIRKRGKVRIVMEVQNRDECFLTKYHDYAIGLLTYEKNKKFNISAVLLGEELRKLHDELLFVENNKFLTFDEEMNIYDFSALENFLMEEKSNEANLLKSVKEEILEFIYLRQNYPNENMKQLVHGDVSMRNIILNDKGIHFIDFENVHRGSIYEDLGNLWMSCLLQDAYKYRKNIVETVKCLLKIVRGYQNMWIDDAEEYEDIITGQVYRCMENITNYYSNLQAFQRMPDFNKIVIQQTYVLKWLLETKMYILKHIRNICEICKEEENGKKIHIGNDFSAIA